MTSLETLYDFVESVRVGQPALYVEGGHVYHYVGDMVYVLWIEDFSGSLHQRMKPDEFIRWAS